MREIQPITEIWISNNDILLHMLMLSAAENEKEQALSNPTG